MKDTDGPPRTVTWYASVSPSGRSATVSGGGGVARRTPGNAIEYAALRLCSERHLDGVVAEVQHLAALDRAEL
jgi:hypothetical protein